MTRFLLLLLFYAFINSVEILLIAFLQLGIELNLTLCLLEVILLRIASCVGLVRLVVTLVSRLLGRVWP
jgi:hypothetical protein